MFDQNQLNSIGFRFVTDSIELNTPYGEELARRPRFYGRSELDALKSEQRNVAALMRAVSERSAAESTCPPEAGRLPVLSEPSGLLESSC